MWFIDYSCMHMQGHTHTHAHRHTHTHTNTHRGHYLHDVNLVGNLGELLLVYLGTEACTILVISKLGIVGVTD